jgi:hypothetical protein
VYFQRSLPHALNKEKKTAELATVVQKIIHTLLAAEYLQTTVIQEIYKDVTLRMRRTWIDIGAAFKENATNKAIGAGLEWGKVYDEWEEYLIHHVQENMKTGIEFGVKVLTEHHAKNVFPTGMQKADVDKFYDEVPHPEESDKLGLSALTRFNKEKPIPDLPPAQEAKWKKICEQLAATRLEDVHDDDIL